MKVIVNDANILIDLVELELLPSFFKLEFEFYTTNFIREELLDDQLNLLQPYIDNQSLIVQNMSEDDVGEISKIQQSKPNLTMQDCSTFFQAKKIRGTLITSDNTLRKFAKDKKLDVHGHLWVFDHMVNASTISGSRACLKLNELCSTVNPKLGLPDKECKKRISKWSKL